MFDVILSLIISFTVTYFAIPVIIKVAEMKKLYDVPDARKVHVAPVPSLGGLGIFAGFIFGCLLSIPFTKAPEMQYFIAAAMVIFFLGIKDDILVISPVKKFIGQVLAAFLIVYKGNIQITSMYGFLGMTEPLPETFSLILTYFTILVIINSFNLIDGVDGLAGTLGLMSTALLGLYMYKAGEMPYAILAFALAGSLVGFLVFNFQPAKIFMGDTGSLLIGLINAILVIKFINVAASPAAIFPIAATPAIAFAIMLVPLLDTLRVFGIRIKQRRSPFSPDRNHVHHLLLDRGMSHRTITLSLVAVNLLLIALAYNFRSIGCNWLMLALLAVFFMGIGALYYSPNRSRLFVAKRSDEDDREIIKSKEIVTLTKDAVLERK